MFIPATPCRIAFSANVPSSGFIATTIGSHAGFRAVPQPDHSRAALLPGSVILQVASKKLRHGKKIFKIAPIHHHFELMGWQESKITVRFAIISFILCLLALITLKMR